MRALSILVFTLLLSACNSTPMYQGYFVDLEKNKVFYGDGNPFAQLANRPQKVISRPLLNADINTFEVLEVKGYAKDKNFVYHYGRTVPFADPSSFELLTDYFSKDKNYIFFKAQPIEGAPSQGAKVINPSAIIFDEMYVLSQGKVYINQGESSFTPCDINSFKVLKRSEYSKDNKCVFFKGVKLEGANPKTFKTKGWSYSVDSKSVYFESTKLDQVNPKGFKVLDNDYAKNKHNVFFKGELLVNVSTKYFDSIRYSYAKNIQGVYFEGKLLEGANRKLFRLSGYEKGTDTQNCYYKSEKVDCDTYELPSNKKEESKLSVFDGVDLGKRMTPQERKDSVSKMVSNLLKMKKLNLEALNDKLEIILEEQKSKYEGKYLTPNMVKNIDLSKLDVGFHFELYTPATPGRNLFYEFRGIENNKANFVIHTMEHFGARTQSRTLKGKTLSTSKPLLRSGLNIEYAPFECTFQLGECMHKAAFEHSNNITNHEFEINYKDGYWIRTSLTSMGDGKEELFLFDQYGFVLVHAIKENESLSQLWLRFEDSKN
ncbi:DKNYY domain-containing protein [Pseudoalteromonas luteoviolacea]|uniref:DKNYY domain-containing protein n=1 Tax=Pseudoalteromonas luteoviolacea TaxID=43657 RepID=UPI001F342338|nr:DKNYY domain-containing protein [Pseudoalteromonas luteoviolacea]MCF6440607.1 DKNYY domain-containing protein [Pseudoalteromonas luteoviolacea]